MYPCFTGARGPFLWSLRRGGSLGGAQQVLAVQRGAQEVVSAIGQAIAHAAAYLIRRVPDALDHFNLDADSVSELVEARMGDWLGVTADPQPAAATTAQQGA